MNSNAKERNTSKKARNLALFAFGFLFFIIAISQCDDNKEEKKAETETELSPPQETVIVEVGPKQLIEYVYANSELANFDNIKIEVTEFTKKECSIRVEIPEDMGKNADVVGIGLCMLAAQFLSENGYNMKEIKPDCVVVSPYTHGVTGRSGMFRWWGTAYYNYSSDGIDWKWEKNK